MGDPQVTMDVTIRKIRKNGQLFDDLGVPPPTMAPGSWPHLDERYLEGRRRHVLEELLGSRIGDGHPVMGQKVDPYK